MQQAFFGIDTRNDRGNFRVELTEQNRLTVTNTFYQKKKGQEMDQGRNGQIENEMDFILTDKADVVKDVTVLNKVNVGSGLARCKVGLDFKKEGDLVISMKQPNSRQRKCCCVYLTSSKQVHSIRRRS